VEEATRATEAPASAVEASGSVVSATTGATAVSVDPSRKRK
jgi:hypothetical protein